MILDQNGDKRYVKGPDVVFPKPTEEFLEQDGKKKFKALELNDNMGIYLKVIADYEEDDYSIIKYWIQLKVHLCMTSLRLLRFQITN